MTSYRIRRYGHRWIVVDDRQRAYRYHRYWFGALLELLRLRGWL